MKTKFIYHCLYRWFVAQYGARDQNISVDFFM